MQTLAYLTSADMVPGHTCVRADLHELLAQLAALTPALAQHGWTLDLRVWDDPALNPASYDAIVVGTTWDYHDRAPEFLAAMDRMNTQKPVLNTPSLMRWNAQKSYLRHLQRQGVPTIPTLWVDRPTPAAVEDALRTFECDDVVVKRQVGACASGQVRARTGTPIGPLPQAPCMIQPFLRAAAEHGETSLLYFDGVYSHAVRKVSAKGDYRVQSVFGGTEVDHDPTPHERDVAQSVLAALPEPALYARVDLMTGNDGDQKVMEVELIEPYLYPLQGPHMGSHFAEALTRRLSTLAR
ncbi:MAG: RimK family alpha-L-glutamate ligase [Myxococcota bacterium]